MGTLLMVSSAPSRDDESGVTQIVKPVRIEAFIAKAPVEAFDERVLQRLARLDVIEPNPFAVVRHMRALPHGEVAAARAASARPVVKLAFEFLVPAPARSREVRGARWAEVDRDAAAWTRGSVLVSR